MLHSSTVKYSIIIIIICDVNCLYLLFTFYFLLFTVDTYDTPFYPVVVKYLHRAPIDTSLVLKGPPCLNKDDLT